MTDKEEITKVLNYIEENMRVTDQTSIEYLDSQGNIDRLCLKQNHIIFGRRGSGKESHNRTAFGRREILDKERKVSCCWNQQEPHQDPLP